MKTHKVTRGDEVIIKSSMSHTAIGTDTFYYRAPCTSSEIEATVSRYYGSNGCTDESFDIYKGSEKSELLSFMAKETNIAIMLLLCIPSVLNQSKSIQLFTTPKTRMAGTEIVIKVSHMSRF